MIANPELADEAIRLLRDLAAHMRGPGAGSTAAPFDWDTVFREFECELPLERDAL